MPSVAPLTPISVKLRAQHTVLRGEFMENGNESNFLSAIRDDFYATARGDRSF